MGSIKVHNVGHWEEGRKHRFASCSNPAPEGAQSSPHVTRANVNGTDRMDVNHDKITASGDFRDPRAAKLAVAVVFYHTTLKSLSDGFCS